MGNLVIFQMYDILDNIIADKFLRLKSEIESKQIKLFTHNEIKMKDNSTNFVFVNNLLNYLLNQ